MHTHGRHKMIFKFNVFSNCCLFANDKKKKTKNIDIFEFVQSVYKKFINLLLPLYHMDINTSPPLSWISTGG